PEEPKTILIWRYGGTGGGNRQNKKFSGARKQNKGGKFSGKKAGKHGGTNSPNQRTSGKPKDKPMDPDSPFAALAALKSGMSSKDD
ncbi:MAG: hypothetical protein AAFW66_15130, partial [Pseudomonadota bacterium]